MSTSDFPRHPRRRTRATVPTAGLAATILALATIALTGGSAAADTTIDGPIGLGSAAVFGTLGGQEVTNSGNSNLAGELGVAPGSSVTGFPPGQSGVQHITDTQAQQAQDDTTTAYNIAASLTPTASGLGNLGGQVLVPGVYSGTDLSITGTLSLVGDANSVWVFQSANSLITASASVVQITGGATSCNVFWQVGSSATLGSSSTMIGTVMALQSISTGDATTVDGRLLARNAALTLLNTALTLPSGCSPTTGSVSSSPTITSGAPSQARRGAPYSFDVTASGSAGIVYSVSSGGLAPGLSLDRSSGVISGTPTTAGTFAVTISANNGIAPAAAANYRLVVTDLLAETGVAIHPTLEVGATGVLVGLVLLTLSRRRRPAHRH